MFSTLENMVPNIYVYLLGVYFTGTVGSLRTASPFKVEPRRGSDPYAPPQTPLWGVKVASFAR